MSRYHVRTLGPYTAQVWDNETGTHTVTLFVGEDAGRQARDEADRLNRVDRTPRSTP